MWHCSPGMRQRFLGVRGLLRVRGWFSLHVRITSHPGTNPAAHQPGPQGMAQTLPARGGSSAANGHQRCCQHAAEITLLRPIPAQGPATPAGTARHPHAQRTGFSQTAQAAAIAGGAQRRLGGRIAVPENRFFVGHAQRQEWTDRPAYQGAHMAGAPLASSASTALSGPGAGTGPCVCFKPGARGPA